jgi:hypothetical protein
MIASKVPQEDQDDLMHILKDIEEEDMYIRQRMLREAKQLELYWHGFQYIFWDERVQDFRIPTHDVMEQVSSREETRYIYDYVVNVFKAHGLSLIAAITADIPGIPFTPCDPTNIADVLAAQRAEDLGKVIMKHNKSKLLFYHALFTLYTNHFLCSYTYNEQDEKYGTTEVPHYTNQSYNCPTPDCKFTSPTPVEDNLCPDCKEGDSKTDGQDVQLQPQTIQDGTEQIPKRRQCIRIRGTLNVKLPTFAADQEGIGYLIDYYDQHYAQLRETYPELYDKITEDATDNFERIARMPSVGRLYSDTYLSKLQTLKRVWLRPTMFNTLSQESSKRLHKRYPKGVYFACINENLFAEAEEDCLDDSWTIAKGDLSRAVHGDPLGKPLMPMQDLENIVMNLLVESLEHSVPSTFADPEIIDFETYSKQEVAPGAIYQTKNTLTNPNRQLGDYFYTLKTSTLPQEGVDFQSVIDNKGQFLVGSFPSIFGGPQTEGSKTLGEYQESRNYALQRLSIPNQMLAFWWGDTIYKGVKCYIKNMDTDEVHALRTPDGRNIAVKLLTDDFKAGRFEQIIPEAANDLPVSWSQKRGNVQNMIQLNNDIINQFLFSPENRMTTLKFLGIEEYSDLDSNQAIKQLSEIQDMIDGAVVPIEPTLDEHEIHLRVGRNVLSDPYGQELKKDDPDAYERIMNHLSQHYAALQQGMMNIQNNNAPSPGGAGGPQPSIQPPPGPGAGGLIPPQVKPNGGLPPGVQ